MTLAYILYHAVCCASAASSGRSLHLIISQLKTKYSSSNCPNDVRQTKSSVKKRITVRQTIRSMFGEQTLLPFRLTWNKKHQLAFFFHNCGGVRIGDLTAQFAVVPAAVPIGIQHCFGNRAVARVVVYAGNKTDRRTKYTCIAYQTLCPSPSSRTVFVSTQPFPLLL